MSRGVTDFYTINTRTVGPDGVCIANDPETNPQLVDFASTALKPFFFLSTIQQYLVLFFTIIYKGSAWAWQKFNLFDSIDAVQNMERNTRSVARPLSKHRWKRRAGLVGNTL